MASEKRDRASFEQLVCLNTRIVFQIALSIVGNAPDAEDVTQDAFIRAYVKFESLNDPQRFRAWVCRIARHVALNHLRSDTRFRQREEKRFHDAVVKTYLDSAT